MHHPKISIIGAGNVGATAAHWIAAKGLGDVDTTCAIVGGIVALSAPEISESWLKRREPLKF